MEEEVVVRRRVNRVKLYMLEPNGAWVDLGVGFASVSEGAIVVVSEDAQSGTLLTSKIVVDDVYERQGESIIMWRETGADVDLSLSFQDTEGCVAMWAAIEAVQEGVLMRAAAAGGFGPGSGRSPSSPLGGGGGPGSSSSGSGGGSSSGGPRLSPVLPHVCAAHLGEIRDVLWRACSMTTLDAVQMSPHYLLHDASLQLRQSCIDQVRALIYPYLGLYLSLSSPYLCPTMIDQVRARALP